MEACPAESTNRSRFGHFGSRESKWRYLDQRTYAMSAAPMGAPGCPDFAFSTASADRNLIVFTESWARSTDVVGMCSFLLEFRNRGALDPVLL